MLMNTNRFAGFGVVHVQVEPQIGQLRALREHFVARRHDAGARAAAAAFGLRGRDAPAR